MLGWFALWVGAIGYAYCAVLLAPAGAGDNVVQGSAFDYGRAPQHSPSDNDNPGCLQLGNAGPVSQPAAPAPVSSDGTENLALLPPAAPPLALRTDNRLPGYSSYPRAPDRPLYLRTSRLLI